MDNHSFAYQKIAESSGGVNENVGRVLVERTGFFEENKIF